jgi:hypothetical protein
MNKFKQPCGSTDSSSTYGGDIGGDLFSRIFNLAERL